MSNLAEQIKRKIGIRKLAKKYSGKEVSNLNDEENYLRQLDERLLHLNSNWIVSAEFAIKSHRKVLGKLIVFCKKVIRKILRWYINPFVTVQNDFNGNVVNSLNAIRSQLNLIESNINHKYEEVSKEQQKTNNEIIVIKDDILNLKNYLNSISNELNDETNNSSNYRVLLEKKLTYMETLIKKVSGENLVTTKKIEEDIDYLGFKINQFASLNQIKDDFIVESKNNNEVHEKAVNSGSYDYFLFENKFRGCRENVKLSQKEYLSYFENRKNVLDIGCGRGEFLELMAENNISARGIDMYDDFVEYCLVKGFDATKDDALNHMLKLEENTLDGVFMGHVIEHVENKYLVQLFSEIRKKLKSGSYLVLETPNPQMLGIYCGAFYLDPSHISPVHPFTVSFILESLGFREIKVLHNKYSKMGYEIPKLNSLAIDNLEEFNGSINKLNELLFGYQDYTIVAMK